MRVILQVHVSPISFSEEVIISKASLITYQPVSGPPLHCQSREWAQNSLIDGT